MILVCHAILQDHVTKGGVTLWVAIGTVVVDI